jgi:hypothetical protein
MWCFADGGGVDHDEAQAKGHGSSLCGLRLAVDRGLPADADPRRLQGHALGPLSSMRRAGNTDTMLLG